MNTNLKFSAEFFIEGIPAPVRYEFEAPGLINARGTVELALQANRGIWIDGVYYPARRIRHVRLGNLAHVLAE